MRAPFRPLLLALPCLMALAAPLVAQSSAAMTMNGITFSVTGGTSQSINGIDGGAEVILDGRSIQMVGTTVRVDGTPFDAGTYDQISIDATSGRLIVSADGRVIMEETEIDVLERAAAQGDSVAMNTLAAFLINATQVARDVPRALA